MYKKFLLFFLLLIVLVPARVWSQPKLRVVEGLTPDFGMIYTNELFHTTLHLVNEGKDTLTISGVSASCGCTSALVSSSNIPPKGKGELAITFNPEQYSGSVKKGLSFETNDPRLSHVHIDFSVNVKKILTVDQDYMTYPTATVDSPSTADLTMKNVGDTPVTIRSITSTSQFVTVKPDSTTIQPNAEAIFVCTLLPKSTGIVRGNITFETDNALVGKITTRIFGFVKAPKTAEQKHD